MGKMGIIKIMATCWVVGRFGTNVDNGPSLMFNNRRCYCFEYKVEEMMMRTPGSYYKATGEETYSPLLPWTPCQNPTSPRQAEQITAQLQPHVSSFLRDSDPWPQRSPDNSKHMPHTITIYQHTHTPLRVRCQSCPAQLALSFANSLRPLRPDPSSACTQSRE